MLELLFATKNIPTYHGQDPAGDLSWGRDVGDPGLCDQDVEEEEGQQEGAEDAPAEPPVHAQLSVQHEVEVSCQCARSIDPVDPDHLHRGEAEDEDGTAVVVHHLQHDLTPGCDVEQANTVSYISK